MSINRTVGNYSEMKADNCVIRIGTRSVTFIEDKPPHPGILKPMKGVPVHAADYDHLRFPLLGSPKFDGIRCLNHDFLGPVTGGSDRRGFKPVVNRHVMQMVGSLPPCLDGELIPITDGDTFNEAQRRFMTKDGAPDFVYWVFDYFAEPDKPYRERLADLMLLDLPDWCRVVETVRLDNARQVREYASEQIISGFEGAMLRHPDEPYKQGRARIPNCGMLKVKDFQDAEGQVIDYREQKNNQGDTTGTLGALKIKADGFGVFWISSGIDNATRDAVWSAKGNFICRTITFKFQPSGSVRLPRFPVFKGFRYD